MTYCRPHARYACQSMLNEALTSCELGPPYLCRVQTKSRERSQRLETYEWQRIKFGHTRGRAPDTSCVQNRPCAEDVIRPHSALLDKRDEEKKKSPSPVLLTCGGDK